MSTPISPELQKFADQNGILGLAEDSLASIKEGKDGFSLSRAKAFLEFQGRVKRELLHHRVITNNEYTAWFEKGELSLEQVKAFIQQFSVFSNLFTIAQLHKTINASTLEGMRSSKEILANELGVIFRPKREHDETKSQAPEYDLEADSVLVSEEGTVDGGTFRFEAAHFEWMVRIASRLGMKFDEIGKRRHGMKSTLFFCDELVRLYGSDNYEISQAASYAVENWAAAGFWKQLISGLTKFKKERNIPLPLGFFTYHDRIEDQHAAHTQEELEEYYFEHKSLDEDAFIKYGNEMLDGVAAFWDGLNEQRKTL